MKLHPLHRSTHPARYVGFPAGMVFLLLTPETWTPLRIVAAAMVASWALVGNLGVARLAPGLRGAQALVVLDFVVFPFWWPAFSQWFALVPMGVTALAVNALSAGGVPLLGATAAAGLVSFGLGWFTFGLGPPVLPTVPVYLASVTLCTAYAGVIGYMTYVTGVQLKRSRAELKDINAHLDEIVRRRTAQLLSANEAFLRFVPAEFLRTLGYEDITEARLGDAAVRRVTVLFADIRNFTAMSERMGPDETFRLLNECLTRVGPHVRANHGFVDKYIGDAIMALFPGEPADAVRAATAMQRELAQASVADGPLAGLAIGIGIHVGTVMMGTIGEPRRFEATVISDTVNLTSRLESLTRRFGVTTLLSGEVAQDLPEDLRASTRWLGAFVVKGKQTPVDLYEAFAADPPDIQTRRRAATAPLAVAIGAYVAGEDADALAALEAIVAADPADGPARWWRDHLVALPGRGGDRAAVRLTEK